ncbi:SMP-30/gluconolactonase/LRE family protein [Streptomyces albus subsp. chlorinus]|uniref:SMP-30/gluconolactonase/LRE family protein n=1 Tax=Streptomyces albus TaxID=1888 RepID=UPI00156E3D98|nr:SMP-30/gluconolactonase/LRE family protein [Streptomyces albus]NSC20781.1 SMP-30/gluconolactonase/LRE family protein [Streptomyces albus subsp. chlorinus]
MRAETAVRAHAALGEGPTWDAAAGRLLWVDILGSRVHTWEPATGRRTVLATEQHVGAAKPRAGGGLVVNLRDGVGLYDAGGGFGWLRHEPVPGRRGNDAAVAPDGALWAGTMCYDETPGGGALTRLAPDGTAVTVLDDATVSNGIGWSPDGTLLYYVDSPTRRIDVFDVREDGLVTGRRPLAEVEAGAGYPDGLTVDADGCVWVALWDGAAVRRYTPRGVLDRVVELPVRRPTACAFGGAGLGDLYVTTARVGLASPSAQAGSLLVVPDAGSGVAQPAFAG